MCFLGLLLLLRLVGQRIHPHLLHHGEQAVATGRRKVILQADAVDEVEVGTKYLVGCVAGEDFDEQGDDAFHNQGVAFRLEDEFAIPFVGLQPHAALAAFYQVLVRLILFVKGLLFVALMVICSFTILQFTIYYFLIFTFRYKSLPIPSALRRSVCSCLSHPSCRP